MSDTPLKKTKSHDTRCGDHSPMNTDCVDCGKPSIDTVDLHTHASEFEEGDRGFKACYFSRLAELEDGNFWFKSRNELILWTLEKYCNQFESFLEIGCGTGYVLSGISKRFPSAILYGSDIFTTGLKFAASRLPNAHFLKLDARNIHFKREFDIIGAFDVLEHITEDSQVLREINSALKPRGFVFITVPQHAWLWSPVDVHACHARRYCAADLHRKIESSGFQIIRSTSFVFTLLPFMVISRFLQKLFPRGKLDPVGEFRISPWLNRLFESAMRIDLFLIRHGVNLGVGGSRIVVARKL